MKQSVSSKTAAALVAVLAVVVLATILVVGLTVAMRMDRQASFYHMERTRADLMAREGVEYGKALLKTATGNAADFWVSAPGVITTPNVTYHLSSGAGSSTGSGVLSSANVNRKAWLGDDRLLDPSGGDLHLKWVYLRHDGTRDLNQDPEISPANPIIGRYAFWMDDESGRVNLNTAWKRQSDAKYSSSPGQISLEALPGFSPAMAEDLHKRVTETRPFNTPFEVYALGDPIAPDVVKANRFNITHYTHNADLNPWGEPKIVLTTKASRANGRPFLDILTSETANPGKAASLDISKGGKEGKFNKTLKQLVNYLKRTDWPYVEDGSFVKKYASSDSSRIWQKAIDIVEYVRCMESDQVLVEPIRGRPLTTSVDDPNMDIDTPWSGGTQSGQSGYQPDSFIGTVRRPMITEMGVWVSNTKNAGNKYTGKCFIEVYLPPNYGIDSVALVNRGLRVLDSINSSSTSFPPILSSEISKTGADKLLYPGQYALITKEIEFSTTHYGTNRPSTLYLQVAITQTSGGGTVMDIAPLCFNNDPATRIAYPVDPANVPEDQITSVEVNDPRVNKHPSNWKRRSSGNSFGSSNSNWKGAVSAYPPQDADASGSVSDAGMRMPYVKGHSKNQLGAVTSVAELGYITTGVESANSEGVPWRSVRLQPTAGASKQTVPDWALLDLFAAPMFIEATPSDSLKKLYEPHVNSVAGRINSNSGSVRPFENVQRSVPLAALFKDVSGYTGDPAANVLEFRTSPEGVDYGLEKQFDSIGELCEIKGIADSGEASEAVLRQVAGVATVRGDVFSVYSIGQALKQTPKGELKSNGEKMLHVMMERYFETTTSAPKFRVIYWREISL